jgi:hypothetical protein
MKLHLILMVLFLSLQCCLSLWQNQYLVLEAQCTGEESVDFLNCLPNEVNGKSGDLHGPKKDPPTSTQHQYVWVVMASLSLEIALLHSSAYKCSPSRWKSGRYALLRWRVQEAGTSVAYTAGVNGKDPALVLDYAKAILECLGRVADPPLHREARR